MSSTAKHWLKFTLRWGIAVFGIWYVISNMSLRDRVFILNAQIEQKQGRTDLDDGNSRAVGMKSLVTAGRPWVRPVMRVPENGLAGEKEHKCCGRLGYQRTHKNKIG